MLGRRTMRWMPLASCLKNAVPNCSTPSDLIAGHQDPILGTRMVSKCTYLQMKKLQCNVPWDKAEAETCRDRHHLRRQWRWWWMEIRFCWNWLNSARAGYPSWGSRLASGLCLRLGTRWTGWIGHFADPPDDEAAGRGGFVERTTSVSISALQMWGFREWRLWQWRASRSPSFSWWKGSKRMDVLLFQTGL